MSKLVMVVDDEEDFLYEVRKMLKKEGLRVVTAKNGEEALEMLKETKPDLMLLDVMMPGLDGWSLAERIKKKEDTKNITITMLTVKDSLDDKVKSLEDSGADWHISKPIDRSGFVDTVKWLLKSPPRNSERIDMSEANRGEVQK
ncbi:MAG: response regulator transcription factor [Candidatus Hydrothermarchaeales archaeon]